MSYSFTVRAATKEAVKQKITDELAKVVASQPSHELDRAQAMSAAFAFVDVLPDDESKDVQVSVHGSVGWRGIYDTDNFQLQHASVGVSAGLAEKVAEPATA